MYATATVFITFTNCYCASALDIYFVVDSSASITSPNFNTQKQFLVNLTNKLDIAADKVNVGVTQFADDGYIYQSLSSVRNTITTTVSGLPYLSGSTHTLAGLMAAMADITGTFPNNNTVKGTAKGRVNVPKILVIVTDGCSNLPCSCAVVSINVEPWKSMTCKKFYNDAAAQPANCNSGYYPGQNCANCNYNTFMNQDQTAGAAQTGCMPCADPIHYTDQINSWTVDDNGVSSSPYPNFPVWKVIAMGVGNLVNNTFGRSQISGMNFDHDPNNMILVSWANLNTAVSTIIDAACNTA
jgi:hypothetical protein